MVEIGYFALCMALPAAGYAVAAALIGVRRQYLPLIHSGERAMVALCGLLSLAVLALWYALLTGDFQIQYVAENSNRSMPFLYVVAALWGGQNGSLLFWSWLASVYGMAAVILNRHRYRLLMPYVVATLGVNTFFFVLLTLFVADPFTSLPFTPPDGRGLNPLLQHPLMAIHPPLLYLGMIGTVVPFAFGMAALLSRQLDTAWLRPARRWTLIPWTFLGAGLLLGGKWAYVELGWGGYWGWDPVENSSLIPWLTGTAFLHSIMIQERRDMFKGWNMVLVILTYGLCLLGTFLTRSGIISSVHAFARSSIGPFFAVFLAGLLGISFTLLLIRRKELQGQSRLESVISRETVFLLNNWVLIGMAFAVLWGTVFPLFSQVLTGKSIVVGPPFFNRISVPLGLILLGLTGIGPLLAWRHTSTQSLKQNLMVPVISGLAVGGVLSVTGVRDFWAVISFSLCGFVAAAVGIECHRSVRARQHSTGEAYLPSLYRLADRHRRRYGGYLVHLAVVMLFVGFTGKAFTKEKEFVLNRGESALIGDYTLTYEALAQKEDSNKAVTAAALSLTRDGQFLCTLLPERHFYRSFDQGTTEVALYSNWREDFYLSLVGAAPDHSAKFHVYINPLVNWIWGGGVLFILGAAWAVWPTGRDRQLAALDRAADQGFLTLPSAKGPV